VKVGNYVLRSRAHPSLRTPVGDAINVRMNPEKCVAIEDDGGARAAA
jgi:iron(III) transport system ATP-binding protein